MLFIFTGLCAFAGLGMILVLQSSWKKLFRQARAMLLIDDPDRFIQAAKDMLDARFAKDSRYQPNAQLNRLELYQLFNSWVTRKVANPLMVAAIPILIELAAGLGLIRAYGKSLGRALPLETLLVALAVVAAFSIPSAVFFKRNVDILKILDRKFYSFVEPDRVELSRKSYEEQAMQSYRLGAIDAISAPRSEEDVLAAPRSMADASSILRGGVAFLAGIGFFLVMVFGGGIFFIELIGLDDSVFPVFLLTGFIGMLIIWFGLMIYWSDKKQKRARAREQGAQPTAQPPYPAAQPFYVQYPQQPYPSYPSQQPLPQAASLVCPNCHRMISLGVEICPYCGHQPPRPTNA